MTRDDAAALRTRLLELRDDALHQLATADHIDAGLLALVAHATDALAAVDAISEAAEPAPGARVIVSDDGRQITLVAHAAAQSEPLASVEISPLTAIRLSAELAQAAARHLQKVVPSLADALQRRTARSSEERAALPYDDPAAPQGTSCAPADADTGGAS